MVHTVHRDQRKSTIKSCTHKIGEIDAVVVPISPTVDEQLFLYNSYIRLNFGIILFRLKKIVRESCSYNVGEIDL